MRIACECVVVEVLRVAVEVYRLPSEVHRLSFEVCHVADHRVEVRRLADHRVEVCRLAVEVCRLAVEVCRLAVEMRRLAVEMCRLAVEMCRLADHPVEIRHLAVEMRRLAEHPVEMRRLAEHLADFAVDLGSSCLYSFGTASMYCFFLFAFTRQLESPFTCHQIVSNGSLQATSLQSSTTATPNGRVRIGEDGGVPERKVHTQFPR